jgi:hypothetical protein
MDDAKEWLNQKSRELFLIQLKLMGTCDPDSIRREQAQIRAELIEFEKRLRVRTSIPPQPHPRHRDRGEGQGRDDEAAHEGGNEMPHRSVTKAASPHSSSSRCMTS